MVAADVPEMSDDDLLGRLRALHRELDADMRAKWNRSLPSDELLSDRWERARSLGFAEDASIYLNAYVYGDVRVGRSSWIGPLVLLDGSGGGIDIGEHCSISAGVHIYTHDTVRWALTAGAAPFGRAPVRIGDCTYIGPQSVIAKGVEIGDHVVVGACSFVNADIPSHSIAVGTPCRVIGRVVVEGDDVRLEYGS
jgi:acetyltransferase-like isoleucine patch superfamily enzyme